MELLDKHRDSVSPRQPTDVAAEFGGEDDETRVYAAVPQSVVSSAKGDRQARAANTGTLREIDVTKNETGRGAGEHGNERSRRAAKGRAGGGTRLAFMNV